MNKRILGLALPNIITNITVPLLGMVDTAIVGHLSSAHLGGIAIGASIFNLIYWNFGFLRMGTSGFTAQSYGARRFDESVKILVRAQAIAAAVALCLIVLQWPIAQLSTVIFAGGEGVMAYALQYFFVRIWAAPATLGLYGLKGWFIGMQNSKLPMWIAIMINVVNILCSLLFVLGFHWGIQGVALGTVIAQYCGLGVGYFFAFKYYGRLIVRHFDLRGSLRWNEMRGFFRVNGDIFLRTVCLSLVFTFVTAASGRISDEVLAIDTLLLQFFHLFSYFMDGFAYAGESLVGRYIGAKDPRQLRLSVRLLLMWGLIVTGTFTLLYALFSHQFLGLFSNDPLIVEGAMDYLLWVLAIPVCGFAAFLFDGIFIGATASRVMRNSMFVASACFFAVYYGGKWMLYGSPFAPPNLNEMASNNVLWLAFMVYISLRGILQAAWLPSAVYKKGEL